MSGRAQPRLRAGELLLRPWHAADAGALVEAFEDPAIRFWHARTMTAREAVEYVEAANRSWTEETSANWAVTAEGVVLGRMTLRCDLVEGLGEVGYWVLAAARGRGVAARALIGASRWGLDDLGLHRIELEHSTRNPASCRVAAKARYVLEGVKRSHTRHADGWHDMHLHALLTDDGGMG